MKVGDMTTLPRTCPEPQPTDAPTTTRADAPTRQEIHRKNTTVLVQIVDD